MASHEKDVIIFDGEYTYAGEKLKTYCSDLSGAVEKYVNCMEQILSDAIQDSEISSELSQIVSLVKSIKAPLDLLSSAISEDCESFITEIDQADQFLY